ncbi:MAG: VCBS repeat-containing protein [Cyclobacteriaceae bacterium]|nr:VCBS repeat-containing protein [Cyclobacteriaceae bacterium]
MRLCFFVIILLVFFSCEKKNTGTLFRVLSPGETGIDFINRIEESDTFNILTYEYIYNGGGVAVADFNNDALPDIFFTGNQVLNRLYLNQGNLKFKDVTEEAGVNVTGRWNSGVTVVDINNDGWPDVYVCATAHPDAARRRNMLFVNTGTNSAGVPVFKEMAAAYNIDYPGNSVAATFFDYDKDGDLDLYILENVMLQGTPITYREKIKDGTAANSDKLFRNDNGFFTDVSIEAGIVYEGYGLGLTIQDFNNDSWPDIYVSNDYLSNDVLYINLKNGKFANETALSLGHQSNFSMGNDAGDINNDGLPDLITLDMLPEGSDRKKSTISNKMYQSYLNNEAFGYEYQHVRNMLQLNTADNELRFSEIGQLAGIHQTEWSWSALLADFDNDGWRDLVVTNGFPKDITDRDFGNYRSEVLNVASPLRMIDSIPVVKVPNYAFKNNGDLTFTDVSTAWGLDQPSFSNGAAFADLDNDGDLDYIVNNINGSAFLYENRLNNQHNRSKSSHFLRIDFEGPGQNTKGLGSKVYVYYGPNQQYYEHYTFRGYLSSVEGIAHFGLGQSTMVDSVRIIWPDGKQQTLKSVPADRKITVSYQNATEAKPAAGAVVDKLLVESAGETGIMFRHQQRDIIDFNIQRTIPHKFSQFGPALAVGDVNGDGLEDLYVGGSTGIEGRFFIQNKDGKYTPGQKIMGSTRSTEETGALLFDFDNDGDLDLYLARGGFEQEEGAVYQSDLYINHNGTFTLSSELLPEMKTSTSCVRAADFDDDGDLDLFIGSRVIPGSYPLPPRSYILKYDNGRYIDVTDQVCPELMNLGMVTDAIWTDYDNNGTPDLVVVGELMAITVFKNEHGKLSKVHTPLDNYVGWWNSITGADFDQDGDIDYVVGNLGLNNWYKVSDKKPLRVFAKDLDNNGSIEALLFCYTKMTDGTEQLCPVHFWDELNQQSPRFRRQFKKYRYFSRSTWETLLSENDKKDAYIRDVNYAASVYVENLGNGNFQIHELPVDAQLAPVNGILAVDVNGDSWLDLLLVGNDYGNEVFIGRYDALTGVTLINDTKGGFKTEKPAASGFYVPHDAKALVRISKPGGDLVVASQNRDSLRVFTNKRHHAGTLKPERLDEYAVLTYANGKKQKVEFYYGSGFLSQSTRTLNIPKGVTEIEIYNSKGESRQMLVVGM